MFVEAFGLRRDPFMDTADPAFYYETIACANGRRRLAECVLAGRGLAAILGPIGVGKTTLCNAVQQDVLSHPACRAGLILDPTFESEIALLDAVARALDVDVDAGAGVRDVKDGLKRALFASVGAGTQYALFIDEVQLLPEGLLESLRSILNYQIDDRKLLSVVLSGQPELAHTLARHPGLADRIALWLELGPLAESEAGALLDHR
jgi:general secretion pathway protein A